MSRRLDHWRTLNVSIKRTAVSLSLFGYIIWMNNCADANKMITASLLEEWKRLPGHFRITWVKTVLDDVKVHELTLKQSIWLRTSQSWGCWLWVNVAQNRPLLRLLAMSERGSEPATRCCWLWVNMAQNRPVLRLLAMSERGSELASLEAAGYEWTWLITGHSW